MRISDCSSDVCSSELVTIEAVVRDVQLTVGEPGRERRVRPIQHLSERRVPVQQLARLVGPEPLPVGGGAFVELCCPDGLRGELGRRGEAPGLGEKMVDLAAHARSFAGSSRGDGHRAVATGVNRSEEHTSELQSLMRISYAAFCLKKKKP